MASIELTGIWLALLSDLETQLHFTQVSIKPSKTVSGSFGAYANGVVRFIRGSGKITTLDVEIKGVTRTERETLEAWEGEEILFRDSRGRILVGAFANLDTPERQGSTGLCDASFTFGAVTHSFEV